jgi:hypothetical protein
VTHFSSEFPFRLVDRRFIAHATIVPGAADVVSGRVAGALRFGEAPEPTVRSCKENPGTLGLRSAGFIESAQRDVAVPCWARYDEVGPAVV